jgi:uncharacterized damage-inducible protein DinB
LGIANWTGRDEAMIDHFTNLAAYNRWANERIYAAAQQLPQEDLLRPVGAFFGSLLGTLNHLLVTDRVWLARLGDSEPPLRSLDTILFTDLCELARARRTEDERLIRWLEGKDELEVSAHRSFQLMSGQNVSLPTSQILSHLFNHQTHHRGQAHTCLTILSNEEPPVLDILAFHLEPH